MSVNRETHRTFLADNGASEELVDRTMKLMEPFFVNAENGTYSLMPKEVLEAEGYGPRFAKAIAKATGQEVKKIILVSMEHPYPKPEWMSEEDFQKSLRNTLEVCHWNSLWDSLVISLRVSLGDSLGDRLLNSLGISFWDSIRDRLRYSLVNNLWYSLWLLNGFALANDKENFERFVSLVELQAKGLMLRNLKHEQGTWAVLCK